MPTLVIAGSRDPLVRIDRLHRLAVLPDLDVVRVPGAHALNFSAPEVLAALIDAHVSDQPPATDPARGIEVLEVPRPRG